MDERIVPYLPEGTYVYEKKTYSMLHGIRDRFGQLQRRSVVLYGIRTDVCVKQTALDLIEMGCEVRLLTDATSAATAIEYDTALDRMVQAGVYLETVESCVAHLVKDTCPQQVEELFNM